MSKLFTIKDVKRDVYARRFEVKLSQRYEHIFNRENRYDRKEYICE